MFSSQLTDKLKAMDPGPIEPAPHASALINANAMGTSTTELRPASRSPKTRSLSDGGPPSLSPSPKFREPEKRKSKDDTDTPATPQRRPLFPARGLSLQMPPRDFMSPNTSAYINRAPLSPKLDHSQTYGSPSLLPRHSRGMEFSRAATNLHHSTLAEQSSPDSSPTLSGRAMNIPSRKNGSHFYGDPESINNNSSSLWSTMANSDRMVSGSLGSINMADMDSSDSSDYDDVMEDDIDDSILTTPQVGKMAAPFGAIGQSPGNGWASQSPAVSSLMNFQRARLHHHSKSKQSSSSGSGNSMASPISKSPPTMRSVENMHNSYMSREMSMDGTHSRRESISWAANQLHISGSESDDSTLKSTLESVDGSTPITPGRDGQRGVIRRAVTRRGNMLPKPKGFARIRAALAEESTPLETEFRREAEVVRQTRESELDIEPPRRRSLSITQTSPSSPSQGPVTQDSLGGIPEDDIMADISNTLSSSFKHQAMRNSKGKEYWETFSDNGRTPPPAFLPRGSSSGISEELSLGSPRFSTPPSSFLAMASGQSDRQSSPSRSSTPQPGPTPAEITREVNRKRRREDDFDPSSFKRRAVSPGMSVHNSPIMQSPMQRDQWGSRPGSNGEQGKSGMSGGPMKRVGFQGMVDTSDGLMKMSIE